MSKNNYEPPPATEQLKLDARLRPYALPSWASMPGMPAREKKQETLDMKVQ